MSTKSYYGGILKQFSFPRKKRIRSPKQFKAVLARDLCASNGLLTLCAAENDCGYPRLGISVGKHCGGAVVRNRLKRLLREAFRQNQDAIPSGFDYLLMISPQWSKRLISPEEIKKAASKLSFQQISSSFLALIEVLVRKKRIGINT